ncbi:hypothetical protein CEY12_00330 [Chryseobacterium sp. T16E-39]|uniref:hypothetical protein n=1 Tax=Chryseobacterium sp. T16E-39 TaxID=2015076 RepID=UPI000B5B3E1D|nr:hypothetical protein [Chryseobacterium sp. T16E-39]ASK28647.1 hypothetical protein CEY12_00330 [Chryseobacterium sp. T16E-39]
MKKLTTFFKLFALAMVLSLTSCQNETTEVLQENTAKKESLSDLKKELSPSSQTLASTVQVQLEDSKKNLEQYLKTDLQITGITVLGKLSTEKGIAISKNLISGKETYIASGNIVDPNSVKVGKIGNLTSGEDLSAAQNGLTDVIAQEVKINTDVLEITWVHKGEQFTSLCFYNKDGIIWDNILGGLVMMERGSQVETSNNNQAKVLSKWFKEWWTAKWLWGSKRGEAGYKITIYYNGSTVSNADVSDWGNISLGKAKSESKILKKTGAYGQCRYALGLCTPTGSLSFNSSNFTVSFSGLGSNIVSNGTKSLYP